MQSFVARQPILDRFERVYGYELRARAGEKVNSAEQGNGGGEEAAFGFANFDGVEESIEDSRAFIKCTRQALVIGDLAKLPTDRVVLEMPASLQPDAQVLQSCRSLKDRGYLIALENYVGEWQEPLADLTNIIRLDVTVMTDRAQWLLIRKYRPKGALFVAGRVNLRPQFQAAVQQGFSYFQGHFFTRPQPYSTAEITPTKLIYLLVLRAVTRPELNVEEIADTIRHDLVLSYNLLRFLNSARFAFHSRIKSIRHALLLLGHNEIRKWIGLISIAALGEGSPPILVNMALIRAAFCESLAPLIGVPKRQPDYFFLGLLSCIDVLMRRPMRVLLGELPIAPDIAAALLGEESPMRDVLRAVLSYEEGNWDECAALARKLAIKEETLADLYRQALRWSRELSAKEKDKAIQ